MFARSLASLLVLSVASVCLAQSPGDVAAETPGLVTVPGLTPVLVRIDDEINCKTNKAGDRFRITVAEDVRVGDAVVIPAGSAGEGEVIHAARPGAGGKAGELIVAARYVRVGDNEIRLRSFALGAVGEDKSVDSLAATFVVGPFSLLQRGGVVIIPSDTLGLAKTALEFRLPAVKTQEGEDDESKAD